MGEPDSAKSRKDAKADAFNLNRTVGFYTLLMAVVGCVNVWIYWVRGNRLSLGVAILAFAGMIAWYFGARLVLARLDQRKG